MEVDYVVVGSGAGGASAAVTLARGGASVVLVEAGAWRDPEHIPSSAYGGMRDLMPDFGAAVTMGRANWPLVQGKGVGGGTLINSAICVRTPGDIFENWKREHGVGGDEMAQRVWAIQEQMEAELSATATPASVYGRSNALALKAADTLGFEHKVTKRYVKDCAGSGQCLQGCGKARKQSMNLTYIPEMVRLGGTVLSCAPVHKVTIESGRAVGVTGWFKSPRGGARGANFNVRASKGVVMAASVVHSPVLLRRSGLRHAKLGREFRAHPGTGIFGWYDDPVDMNTGATQGWASAAFREQPGFKLETLAIPPELVASRVKGGGRELVRRLHGYRHLAMWCMAVRADTVGSIWRGPLGPVVVYRTLASDMQKMRTAAHFLARMHFAAGARYVVPGVHGLPWRITPDQLGLLEDAPLDPRAWVGVLSHLFGGCTMGADPSTSVCDGRGRVHGVKGLVVADASQIPTNLGVNPQHTIMALGRIHAEDLLAEA